MTRCDMAWPDIWYYMLWHYIWYNFICNIALHAITHNMWKHMTSDMSCDIKWQINNIWYHMEYMIHVIILEERMRHVIWLYTWLNLTCYLTCTMTCYFKQITTPGVAWCCGLFFVENRWKFHIVAAELVWPLAHLKCRKKSLGTIFKISLH